MSMDGRCRDFKGLRVPPDTCRTYIYETSAPPVLLEVIGTFKFSE